MSLEAALAYVWKNFKYDMGGTVLLPALQAILQAKDTSLLTRRHCPHGWSDMETGANP